MFRSTELYDGEVLMYSIGKISKIVDVSVDTLRYYDEIGLLKPFHINKYTNYRYYSEQQINILFFIMEQKVLDLV